MHLFIVGRNTLANSSISPASFPGTGKRLGLEPSSIVHTKYAVTSPYLKFSYKTSLSLHHGMVALVTYLKNSLHGPFVRTPTVNDNASDETGPPVIWIDLAFIGKRGTSLIRSGTTKNTINF